MLERLCDAGFELLFTSHAEAIILHDFPELVEELESSLLGISLPMTEIIGGGGGEAKMTQRLRRGLAAKEWTKHNFELKKTVDGVAKESISHEIDHVRRTKSGVFALEIEWNNKDPFFDRDLENFKRLHAEGAISVGGIVTRGSAMQSEMRERVERFATDRSIANFEALAEFGAGSPTGPQRKQIEADIARGTEFAKAWSRKFTSDKFGQATTHWSKLQDRVHRGVGNPCPLVLIGLPPSIIDMTA
ncbi:MAG: restriction endonuclease [Sphingomonas sp.]|uniref:BglII/BstYI family type II restriction endonuclease n=1 Tax=Sphingomonas sp. TaxID=28214 RepID=UPI0011F877F2|nr:BglII/BstYI family type II restriction endonuclease [Sphingomonas sp.]THD37871.1 MAG: restriction endonuclease [Sphingomonas sp.]